MIPTDLLSEDDCSYIRNESHDDGEKARKIVDAVLQQVKAEATLFHTFVGAMKQLPWIRFVGNLEEAYGQQCSRKNENEEKDNGTLYALEGYQRELSLTTPAHIEGASEQLTDSISSYEEEVRTRTGKFNGSGV